MYPEERYARAMRRRRRAKMGSLIGLGLVIVLGLGGCLGLRAAYKSSERTVQTVVTGKENVCNTDSSGKVECEYLVFTEAGTFKIVDSIGLLGGPTRFDSSDLYGRIKVGPATLVVIGWRLPLFSEYPNIVEVVQE